MGLKGDVVQFPKTGFKGLNMLVVMCNHCPYVKHILPAMVKLIHSYQLEVFTVAINPNDAKQYPDDSSEHMEHLIKDYKIDFPYVSDEGQSVAKSYAAECTPEFYLFNEMYKLVYHGCFDRTQPLMQKPTGQELREAIELTLKGQVVKNQHPSLGCSIKWRSAEK
jgi:hypothetical protein